MPNQDEDNTAILSKAEVLMVKNFCEQVNSLDDKKPDPTEFLILRGHALVDAWLKKWIDFINTLEPVNPDNPALQVLSKSYISFLSSRHPKQPSDLNFIGKVKVLEGMRIHPPAIMDAIRRLNKIRNDYAHNFDAQIDKRHVDFILSGLLQDESFRQSYSKLKSAKSNDTERLHFVLAMVLGWLMQHLVVMKGLRRRAF